MRFSGITIPDTKRLEVGLTVLHGIGRTRAQKILSKVGIDPHKKAQELSEDEEVKIREELEKYRLEGDLKRDVSSNIQRLKDIRAYRGTRHSRGLPVRGQRTKTNQRTRKGNARHTMGSGRRKVEKK